MSRLKKILLLGGETRNKSWRATALATIALTALTALSVVPATAASGQKEPVGKQATYEGRTIDLGRGWQGAQACAAWSDTDIRCYRSVEDMIEDEGGGGNGDVGSQAKSDCPSGWFSNEWFCLFEFSNWQGRMLKFKDPNYCQYLYQYGFNNQAGSYANTLADSVAVYDATYSCSNWLATFSGHSSSAYLNSLNDRISSIYIIR